MTTERPANIAELERDVNTAKIYFEEAKIAASLARNREAGALNQLNKTQKALDERINELRLAAPAESDWKASIRPNPANK